MTAAIREVLRLDRFAIHRGGDEVSIDPALAALLRHHTEGETEFEDAVAFCQEQFSTRQLEIMLSRMGSGGRLLVDHLHVERKNRGRVLKASITYHLHIRWYDGRLHLSRDSLPASAAHASVGRPLRDVVDHPYVPDDLVIAAVETGEDGQWVITPGKKEGERP